MRGCLESCGSEKRRKSTVDLQCDSGLGSRDVLPSRDGGFQEQSEHHRLSERVCALAHKLSSWCNVLRTILRLLVCPALGEPFPCQLQGHSPCGVPGTPCSLCLAHKEAMQMVSGGSAFARSVAALGLQGRKMEALRASALLNFGLALPGSWERVGILWVVQ